MALSADYLSRPWPADGLEGVERCPVCADEGRELLHSDLKDRIFCCAPGNWKMYRCSSCGSGYLNPRPTPQTIALAYRSYFTHSDRLASADIGTFRRVRRMLANGYRNHHYKTNDLPSSSIGLLAARLFPAQRAVIDASMRHLPSAFPGGRLLDLGCGNGEFLARAASAGWEVVGVDFDPKAVDIARNRGLNVRVGGIDVLDPEKESFHGITLGHVIEHLHDPIAVLAACYRLLQPDGWIWLDTPNLEAEGHHRYGPHWRGLEPPRHLVIFTRSALRCSLQKVGFDDLVDQPYRPLCADIFGASEAIAESCGLSYGDNMKHMQRKRLIRGAEVAAKLDPERREFITMKAWKRC